MVSKAGQCRNSPLSTNTLSVYSSNVKSMFIYKAHLNQPRLTWAWACLKQLKIPTNCLKSNRKNKIIKENKRTIKMKKNVAQQKIKSRCHTQLEWNASEKRRVFSSDLNVSGVLVRQQKKGDNIECHARLQEDHWNANMQQPSTHWLFSLA